MSSLAVVLGILALIVRIYTYVLWGRFILEWLRILRPGLRPRGILLILSELIFSITDPPIKFIRKVLPPIKLGTIRLDLGWMITMLACLILLGLIS